jgi:lysyl-tRNA synthetase class 2
MQRISIGSLPGYEAGTCVCLAGRVVSVNRTDAAELLLRDESGLVRVLLGGDVPPVGSLVRVSGAWVPPDALSEVTWLEVQPPLKGFGRADSDYVRVGRRAENLRRRAQILRWVREFFDGAGFLEVETPLVVPSPGLDVHLDAPRVLTPAGERYLITSPEYQMKRLLSGGLERIYQLGKCFRNDEVGERHQPEFTMLEWYRAFAGMEEVMRDTEELVAHVARAARRRWHYDDLHEPERAFLYLRGGELKVDVTPPWPRLTVREAFDRYAGMSMDEALRDEEQFYRLLVERVEPALAELGAVFLCEYPASQASLARKKTDDPSVAERFEAYVAGVELCNGFGELTDPIEQRARLERDQAERRARGLPVYPIDEAFLAALEQGMPPSGGNALGLDRLVMLTLGAAHIEDVLAIPASEL